MKILIADDSAVGRELVIHYLRKWGHEPLPAEDGKEALAILLGPDPPPIGILDWEMPELSGPEVCARVLSSDQTESRPYLFLLTAREEMSDLVEGLEAGADDYLTKPFDESELRARLRVGERLVGLQARLRQRVAELEDAMSRIRRLEELLPICSYCKKVRDDDNYWHRVETYIEDRTGTRFSHGICPDCYEERAAELMGDADDGGA